MAGGGPRLSALGLLEATGRPVVLGLDWLLAALGLAARSLAAAPQLARGPAREEFLRALRLGLLGPLGVQAAFALLVGVTLVGQGLYWLTFAGQSGLIRTLMVDLLAREVAPMLAALVLLARLGTRNLVELSAIRAGPAWRGLAGMGIDPWRTLVAPRALAGALAGFAHTVVAVVLAALGGHLTALALGASTLRPMLFLASVLDSMTVQDFLLVAIKGPALGFAVALATAAAALASAELAGRPATLLPRGLAVGAVAAIGTSVLLGLLL
jgi:ABC-type transporter Mla maintaining outer membrane lipid asymmetry permease subunit MlaE